MISIIVPVYMAEKTLCRCVESIIHQSFSDFEVILVDDGSTDKSGELCDSYAEHDSRINVIHKENGGVSSARNTGILASSGEYISFCDSDDYLELDYLEGLYQTAKNHPECDHIWCCFNSVSSYHVQQKKNNASHVAPVELCNVKSYASLQERVLTNQPWNKLYRAEIIKKKGIIFPETMSLGEDLIFNLAYLDASENDKIALIREPLYNYFSENENSLDKKFRPNLLEIYKEIDGLVYDHLEKWDVSQDQFSVFYNYQFFHFESVLDNTMKNPSLSLNDKIKQNSCLLRTAEFKDILNKRNCFLHPLYLRAYKSGNYDYVFCLKRVAKMKKIILGKH